MKIRISDFNKKYFSTLKLEISSMYLNNTTQMITVGKFEDKEHAMDYYNFIKDNPDVMKSIKQNEVKQYVITDQNYLIYYKNKEKRESYEEFFNNNYIKN